MLVPLQGAAAGRLLLSECCVHFGAGLLVQLQGRRCRVPLQGAAVRVLFALWGLVAAGYRCKVLLSECCVHWSWVAGAAAGVPAGCRCKVLLSECCLCFGAWLLQGAAARCCMRFGAWLLGHCRVLLEGAAGAGAAAVASFARCCPVQGFFSFSLLVFRCRRALVGWYSFKPRLASFWLRFFLPMLRLRWCCLCCCFCFCFCCCCWL